MPGLVQVLLVIAVLLVLVSLLQPLANRLRLPHSVLLAGLGIAFGVWSALSINLDWQGTVGELAAAMARIELSSEAILYTFLPILLFQTGLTMDVRRMVDDLAPILMLAVVAVLVCTVVVGYALAAVSEEPLLACLLLGAIIATTDPVAVVGIFRELGAPRRLSILVEGESLLNDAAAIALFSVLLAALVTGRDLSLSGALWMFTKSFVGGALIGFVAARLAVFFLRPLGNLPLAETSVTLALAYAVFIVAQRYLEVSGVVAVVVAAIVIAAAGRTRLSASTWQSLMAVWNQLGFWAAALVFIFASMRVPEFLDENLGLEHALLLLVVVAAAFAARAIVLYGLLPVLTAAGLAERVSGPYKLVILWGGLRGALTLALALGVTENLFLSEQIKAFVAVLATGFVLFTLLVNGLTLRPMIRLLHLDRLPPIDRALRNRTLVLSLQSVLESIAEAARGHRIDPEVADEVVADYRARLDGALSDPDGHLPLTDREQRRLGLIALATREEELYLAHHADRTVSRTAVVALLAKAGALRDGARTAGRVGYLNAARDRHRFRLGFRIATLLQRWLHVEGPLARRLADRFETLLITRMVLEELQAFARTKLAPLLGERTSAELDDALRLRLDTCARSLDALRLQYPDYERILESRFLRQAALRMEAAEYDALLDESAISREIYDDLTGRLRAEAARLAQRPRLDLGLETADLVRRFPMFAGLGEDRLRELTARLKPQFAYPGRRLVSAGERGDAMYFISSGAVEVERDGHIFRLGRGDFFGELALLTGRRRLATVTAISYGKLLVLQGRDFRRFVKANPDLRARIREVAAERQAAQGRLIAAAGIEQAPLPGGPVPAVVS